MSDPAKGALRTGRPNGASRPVWIGWSVSVIVLAAALIGIAAGASDRGLAVQVPPAINLGSGLASRASPSTSLTTVADDTTTSTSTTTSTPDPTTPTTLPVQTSVATVPGSAPSGGTSQTSGSSPDKSSSGHDGAKEQGDSPSTVAPDYPVIVGTSTSSTTTGGSDT